MEQAHAFQGCPGATVLCSNSTHHLVPTTQSSSSGHGFATVLWLDPGWFHLLSVGQSLTWNSCTMWAPKRILLTVFPRSFSGTVLYCNVWPVAEALVILAVLASVQFWESFSVPPILLKDSPQRLKSSSGSDLDVAHVAPLVAMWSGPYWTVLFSTVLYYNTVQYCIAKYGILQFGSILEIRISVDLQYCTVYYCTVSTVLYCTVQYCFLNKPSHQLGRWGEGRWAARATEEALLHAFGRQMVFPDLCGEEDLRTEGSQPALGVQAGWGHTSGLLSWILAPMWGGLLYCTALYNSLVKKGLTRAWIFYCTRNVNQIQKLVSYSIVLYCIQFFLTKACCAVPFWDVLYCAVRIWQSYEIASSQDSEPAQSPCEWSFVPRGARVRDGVSFPGIRRDFHCQVWEGRAKWAFQGLMLSPLLCCFVAWRALSGSEFTVVLCCNIVVGVSAGINPKEILYCTVMYCTVLYSSGCTVHLCTVLRCRVGYDTVLYCIARYCKCSGKFELHVWKPRLPRATFSRKSKTWWKLLTRRPGWCRDIRLIIMLQYSRLTLPYSTVLYWKSNGQDYTVTVLYAASTVQYCTPCIFKSARSSRSGPVGCTRGTFPSPHQTTLLAFGLQWCSIPIGFVKIASIRNFLEWFQSHLALSFVQKYDCMQPGDRTTFLPGSHTQKNVRPLSNARSRS